MRILQKLRINKKVQLAILQQIARGGQLKKKTGNV